jgi:hypothetical protein
VIIVPDIVFGIACTLQLVMYLYLAWGHKQNTEHRRRKFQEAKQVWMQVRDCSLLNTCKGRLLNGHHGLFCQAQLTPHVPHGW